MKNQRKSRKQKFQAIPKSMSRDALKKELSNPKRLKKYMDKLEKIVKTRDEFSDIRFPSEKLLQQLDDIAQIHFTELNQQTESDQQRETILKYCLPSFITDHFVEKMEAKLMDYLKICRGKPSILKAVSSGLFFIEIHRRHPQLLTQNPLWNMVFDISYHEAMESSGGMLRQNEDKKLEQLKLPGTDDFEQLDLEAFHIKILKDAITEIEKGHVELGFSLDTILQGLRSYRKVSRTMSPDDKVKILRDCYRREIGERERDDLIWGLEYALDHADSNRKKGFQKVYDGVALLTARENPVMFALYYKCVIRFYRFLNPGELDEVKSILENPDDLKPVINYGCMLYKKEAPKRALKAFEAALNIDPTSGQAYFCKGIALWEIASFNEARLFFEKSIQYWKTDTQTMQIIQKLINLCNGDTMLEEGENILFLIESGRLS